MSDCKSNKKPCRINLFGGPGCGKSTLLNIIGGLDRYDTGDLIINNVSTKDKLFLPISVFVAKSSSSKPISR